MHEMKFERVARCSCEDGAECVGQEALPKDEFCAWDHAAQAAREATRLLGFALFNHAKGNQSATETLMRKAYKALNGAEWDAVA